MTHFLLIFFSQSRSKDYVFKICFFLVFLKILSLIHCFVFCNSFCICFIFVMFGLNDEWISTNSFNSNLRFFYNFFLFFFAFEGLFAEIVKHRIEWWVVSWTSAPMLWWHLHWWASVCTARQASFGILWTRLVDTLCIGGLGPLPWRWFMLCGSTMLGDFTLLHSCWGSIWSGCFFYFQSRWPSQMSLSYL